MSQQNKHKFIEVIDFTSRNKLRINIGAISIIRRCSAGCEIVAGHSKYTIVDSYESVCNKIDMEYGVD